MMSMLVSVYGSKELFVKEYCQLLSERLLKNLNYDVSFSSLCELCTYNLVVAE